MRMAVKFVFGQIQEFDPSTELFTVYMERVNLFFTVNNVPDEKKVPGVSNYSWRGHCSRELQGSRSQCRPSSCPRRRTSLTWKDLVKSSRSKLA